MFHVFLMNMDYRNSSIMLNYSRDIQLSCCDQVTIELLCGRDSCLVKMIDNFSDSLVNRFVGVRKSPEFIQFFYNNRKNPSCLQE